MMDFKNNKMWKTAAVTLFFAVLFLGCSDDPAEPEMPEKGIMVSMDAEFGAVLTDSVGATLYFFARDADGNSSCEGDCEANWPVYYSSDAAANAEIDAGDVGVITRADGSMQTTYKGWPLYYFAGDEAAGDINGDGANGLWFVAKPDYSVLLVQSQLVGANGVSYTAELMVGEGQTQYLVDAYGRTLYGFAPDKYQVNTYTEADFGNNATWPTYESEVGAVASVAMADDFAVIEVHGRQQLTYKGWPLYYFGADEMRGDNKGVSVPNPGVWPVLQLDAETAPMP